MTTTLGAAHIVTDDAGMGDPEIVITTREDADSPGPVTVLARFPLPSSHGYADVAAADVFLLTGWSRDGDNTDAGVGYVIVNVTRDDPEGAERVVTECPTCGARYRASGASLVDGDTGRLVRCPDGFHEPERAQS